MTATDKTALTLLATALIAPATVLIGIAIPVAGGATAVLGLTAIALSDYGRPVPHYHQIPVVAPRTERHPLAA